jgi:hypothetical protein
VEPNFKVHMATGCSMRVRRSFPTDFLSSSGKA